MPRKWPSHLHPAICIVTQLVPEHLPPGKLSPAVKLQSTLFELGNQQRGSHESVMTGSDTVISECRRPQNPALKDREPRSRVAVST